MSTIIEQLAEKFEFGYTLAVKIVKHLRQYGYLDNSHLFDGEFTMEDITTAIKLFQKYAGLPETGVFGPKELRVLKTPRCPLPDIPHGSQAMVNKWGIKDLTWYVAKRDNDLSAQEWDDHMEEAFQQIADVCDMRFKKVNSQNQANLIISVGSGRRDGFDSAGGVLAWAQLPPSSNYRGQLVSKFDVAETWLSKDRQGRGIYLLNVGCHEFIHLVGLGHSSVRSALMAPYYSPSVSKPQQRDDITRLQRLYGPPKHDPIPDPDPDPIPDPGEDPIEISIKCQGIVKNNVVTGSKFVMDIDGFRIQKLG